MQLAVEDQEFQLNEDHDDWVKRKIKLETRLKASS